MEKILHNERSEYTSIRIFAPRKDNVTQKEYFTMISLHKDDIAYELQAVRAVC